MGGAFDAALGGIVTKRAVEAGMKVAIDMAKAFGAEKKDINDMKKQCSEQVKEAVEKLKKDTAEAIDDYKKNKAERDKAAFEVIDVGKDGQLQEAEVVAALLPSDPKNDALLQALGFQPTEMGQNSAKGINVEAEPDCNTQ